MHRSRGHATSRRSARAVAALVLLLLSAPALHGGYTGKKGQGQPLTADEAARVGSAIDGIDQIAALPCTGARNRATLERISACLTKMLADGKICREGAADPEWDALCANDLKKGWSGDAININPNLLKPGISRRRALAAALVHEGIHSLQCSEDRLRREWSAYSWEVWALEKWSSDAFPPIPIGESQSAWDRRREEKASSRDAYCAAYVLAPIMEKLRRITEQIRRFTDVIDADRAWYPHRSGPNVVELHEVFGGDEAGTPLHVLLSSFDAVTTIASSIAPDGRAVLWICGTDAAGRAGGLERFVDEDDDGLPDQASRTIVAPLGSFTLPIDLAVAGPEARAYVLDRAEETAQVRLLVDDDGDGLADLLRAAPYLHSDAEPLLLAMRSLDVEPGPSIALSAWAPGESFLEPDHLFLDAPDLDRDGVADAVLVATMAAHRAPARPDFHQDVQAGDLEVVVYAAPGTTIEVWRATPRGVPIELLGAAPAGDPLWRQVVPLRTAPRAGEHVVALAVDHPVPPGPATPVAPSRPEVIESHAEVVLAGSEVLMIGRGLGPEVTIDCAGVPAEVVAATGDSLRFIAPAVDQVPNGMVVVEVHGPGGVAPFVGLQIDGDCDGDGLSDPVAILLGEAEDANGNGVPDHCDPTCPDLDGDGIVGFGDLVALLAAWGPCPGCPADLDGDGGVGFGDLVALLASWGPCPG